ncbi:MAG: homoserine dehydrogenase [Candidatus Liberibacter ctenarytainae]|uniref:Homoserine dehydrogenase n=1 Tax=Candidatus Liberibacter ctenarytainae TaxID=2020335 RepID=A0A937AKR1_9HYPH|nr:homoserine dehydrogenase [Candidatus Liberibacter ctenarytainae]
MEESIKIGVAGLGKVGASLVKIIQQQADHLKKSYGCSFVVSAVSARNRYMDRDVNIFDAEWFDDPVQMADKAKIDIFVELIGGEGYPAHESVRSALMRGCHVVTANKALIATHGTDLALLAQKNGVFLGFEAAVGGGIPIIKALKDSLACNEVIRIYGIINGTCNYILSHMEKSGLSFEECLQESKRCGYAEDNAELDISGIDSSHKIAILSSIAFGVRTSCEGIYCEGISDITLEDMRAASDFGYCIKLVAIAYRTDKGIVRCVYPALLKRDSMVALVGGTTNAVVIETDILGKLVMAGPGAGGDPTASAVLRDICDITQMNHRQSTSFSLGCAISPVKYGQLNDIIDQEKEYFIRLKIRNHEGVLDQIISQMTKFCISFRIVSCPHQDQDTQECFVCMITHNVLGSFVRKAIKYIHEKNKDVKFSRVICIESFE